MRFNYGTIEVSYRCICRVYIDTNDIDLKNKVFMKIRDKLFNYEGKPYIMQVLPDYSLILYEVFSHKYGKLNFVSWKSGVCDLINSFNYIRIEDDMIKCKYELEFIYSERMIL